MREYRLKTLAELERALKGETNRLTGRVKKAIHKTAQQGAAHVRRNVPVAFSELRDSVEATDHSVRADAPHAAAVELGARPHWVPLEALIRWVKLRGMQGLGSEKQIGRLPGTTTARHAQSIARQIRSASGASALGAGMSVASGGMADPAGEHSSLDAPVQIARAIQQVIAKRGTKPHWYMRDSIPTIRDLLDKNVNALIHQDNG